MNSIFNRVSLLLRLSTLLPVAAGIAVLSGICSSAQAADQTPSVAVNEKPVVSAATESIPAATTSVGNPQIADSNRMTTASDSKPVQLNKQVEQALSSIDAAQEAMGKPSLRYAPAISATANPTEPENTSKITAPIPGTTLTSADVLATGSVTGQFAEPTTQASSQTSTRKVAQAGISPGRVTRGGSSYVGIAGNIGIGGGGTSLGNTNFTVISKIGLTNTFSVRPAVVIGNDATFLIPLTYDFNVKSADAFSESLPFSPYLGAGVAVSTRSNDNVAALLSAGVDVPISSQFTATAGVNVGFFRNTDVGLLLGVGYNFVGLGI